MSQSLLGLPVTIELRLLVYFTLALVIFLVVPRLFERIQLSGLLGLILAGALIGPPGFGLVALNDRVVELFAEIGKLMLVFIIGLEIDLQQFREAKWRSILFGLLTFLLPLAGATLISHYYGYGWNSALLIGSLLASHTLIGFPILQRNGIARIQPATVTVGATIFTDIAALLTLAICATVHATGFSPRHFTYQLIAIALYVPIVVFGLSFAASKFARRYRESEDASIVAILLIMAVASIGAAAIRLEDIVGAFLGGLAVNAANTRGRARDSIQLVGSALFVPAFFFAVGMQISLGPIWQHVSSRPALIAGIVAALLAGKYMAASIAAWAFGYSRDERMMMWSLSLPQVAATLAAAFVAFGVKNPAGERLIDEPIITAILLLMVLTSILGPLLTAHYARRFAARAAPAAE